jgi:hypothetical protein
MQRHTLLAFIRQIEGSERDDMVNVPERSVLPGHSLEKLGFDVACQFGLIASEQFERVRGFSRPSRANGVRDPAADATNERKLWIGSQASALMLLQPRAVFIPPC